MKTNLALSLLAVALLPAGRAAAQAPLSMPLRVRFSGVARDSGGATFTGVTGIAFALYREQTGGAPLWVEKQNVRTSPGGRFTVLLGATRASGLPAELFTSGEARWLGVAVDGQIEQPRVLLAFAPYALKAHDAETLGGLPASAFMRASIAPPVTETSSSTKPSAARAVSPDAGCSGITSDGSGAANQVAKFTGPCVIEPSAIFESGGLVGIGTTTPAGTLDVKGTVTMRGTLTMNAKGDATASAGANSNPLDLIGASFNSAAGTSVNQHFRWQAEAAGNNTAAPSATLNLLYASGSGAPAETGLAVSGNGLANFASGQAFPGAGTITGISAGTGLTGGGAAGTVGLGLTTACAAGQILKWSGSAWACVTKAKGTVTAVTAGAGVSGGGTSGNVTLANTGVLSVTGGTGIASSGGTAPAISLNTGYTDSRYLQVAGGTLSGPVSLPANGLAVAGNQLVLANGTLGIGTATPGAPLEVAGNLKISGAGSALIFPDGTSQATAARASQAPAVNPLVLAPLKWFPAYSSDGAGVGVEPSLMAFDGANLWVTNYGSNTVTELAVASGAVLGTYNAGNTPSGIAFDGAYIWVANSASNTVTKLRAATGALVGTYNVGNDPYGVAFDGTNIWVTNILSGNVTKLVAATGAYVGAYTVGTTPAGIAFDGVNVWVSNEGSGTVTKLLAATGALVGTYTVGTDPHGVAFDGTNIWVANYRSNTVTKLLAATGATVGTYNVGVTPQGVVFDGSNIWVANSTSGTVSKLQASSGALLGTFTVAKWPVGLAFDGANIWVTNYSSNTVSKL